MGGGNITITTCRAAGAGLSPRGRGKLGHYLQVKLGAWSIPAWAGETPFRRAARRLRMVYPRVGGGNDEDMRVSYKNVGLSPRGRGKRVIDISEHVRLRSIPAWAGETRPRVQNRAGDAVYPRVGGGNMQPIGRFRRIRGLSPRGRGKRLHTPHCPRFGLGLWSIPAWAGETKLAHATPTFFKVYPRVGGGNAMPSIWHSRSVGLSPRGRGKPA